VAVADRDGGVVCCLDSHTGGPAVTTISLGRLSSPVLIGRGEEIELLVRTVARPPALVLLEGEAGVGKSRLVAELLTAPEVAPLRHVVGQCHPLREPFPLGPVLDGLRSSGPLPLTQLSPLCGALRALLPELSEQLPESPIPLTDARAERHRVFRATVELFAASAPLVLVLEDLHWADETTMDFLVFLLAQGLPNLSVVATYRREDVTSGSTLLGLGSRLQAGTPSVRVTLQPLTAPDVGRLVAAILDTPEVSAEFASYLHRRTSGLPFAVEECLRLLQERGGIVRRGGRWARQALERLEVPTAVRDSIRERLGRLDAVTRRVVEVVAVLDRPSTDEVIAAASEQEIGEVRDGLAAALACGLLTELSDGRCMFRHALARDAVYRDLPGPRRRGAHLAAAQAILAAGPHPPVAQLAHHFQHAGRWEQAARYAEAAADVAAAAHDDAAVCSFLLRALTNDGLTPEVSYRLGRKLGVAASHSFDHAAAAAALRDVIGRAHHQDADRGELRRLLGVLLVQSGNASAGVEQLKQAVVELKDRPDVAMRVMASLAAPWVVEGDVAEHLAWLERAEAVDRWDASPVDHMAFAIDRATALVSLAHPGWRDADAAVPTEARGDDERRELHRGCLNLAQAQLYIGAYPQAQNHLERSTLLVALSPSLVLGGLQHTTQVLLDWHIGTWEGLEERAAQLCTDMAELPHARIDVEAVAYLLALARGHDGAGEQLAAVLPTAREAGSLPVLAMAAGGLGAWHLASGRAAPAVAVCEEALRVLAPKGLWGWLGDVVPTAVAALAATGRPGDGEALRDHFAGAVDELDAPVCSAAVLSADAHLAEARGQWRHAAQAHERAAVIYRGLPRRYEDLRSRAAAVRCALEGGERRDVDAVLQVLEELDAITAAIEARRLSRVLRRHGVALPYRWRGGRRGYGDSLSPREAEVVELIAAGQQTREIAAALFLSPRTVEFHVAKAMRKLGVRSRRELAAAAAAKNP
jgi:DNA-binding CsgD family transcriptional regulator/tetratricopeptide (TPR) repeat protein